jgi:hypothetical protein
MGEMQLACSAAPLAVLFCLAAIIAAWLIRIPADTNPTDARRAMRVVRAWLIFLAILALPACTLLSLRGCSTFRVAQVSAVSSANLRGLGLGIKEYTEDFGHYPPALTQVLDAGIVTARQCLAPFDTACDEQTVKLGYSSFVYRPGIGPWNPQPDVILAHERLSWGTMSDGRTPAITVLFANGNTRLLTVKDFQAAMIRDLHKRRELGWPIGP